MRLTCLFSVLTFLASFTLEARTLPTVPANCFNQAAYCSSVDVVKDQEGRRVIRVKVFARLAKNQYPTVTDLTARYFDFAKWPDYASASDDVDFRASEERRERVGAAEVVRHFAHYVAKAPWPIKSMEVVDLVEYQFITEQVPGSAYSATFAPVASFRGRKGVKHNIGELHVVDGANGAWTISFITDVIPDIDLLPNVAAPYIQRPILAILRGMYDLNR